MIGRKVEGFWGAYFPIGEGVVNGIRTTKEGQEVRISWDPRTFEDEPIDHGETWYLIATIKQPGSSQGIGIYWVENEEVA